MKSLGLPTMSLYVRKTGLPFYDASRLIGVAHLFFGTASADVEDTGSFWILKGAHIHRDIDQVLWIGDRLSQIDRHPTKATVKKFQGFEKDVDIKTEEMRNYFSTLQPQHCSQKGLTNYLEAALQTGTRGVDSLKSYRKLAVSDGDKATDAEHDVYAAVLGLSHAAIVNGTTLILPVFNSRFSTSKLLNFNRYFYHKTGQYVALTLATLSILTDIPKERLPVVDFVYNAVSRPIYESGYLGFERLCKAWTTGGNDRKRALRDIKIYLERTRAVDPKTDKQGTDLARAVAQFAANPTVDKLELIARLKARLLTGLEGDNRDQRDPAHWARDLFRRKETIREVGKMSIGSDVNVQVPESLVWAVANALIPPGTEREEVKGWFNKFVRLENIRTPDHFITEIERILSRAIYDPQGVVRTVESKEGKRYPLYNPSKEDIEAVRSLITHDKRTFRAFKAVFLMEVLSKLRISGATEVEGESGEEAKEE